MCARERMRQSVRREGKRVCAKEREGRDDESVRERERERESAVCGVILLH